MINPILSTILLFITLPSITPQYCDTTGDDSSYSEKIKKASGAHGGYIRHIIASGCPNHPSEVIWPNRNYPIWQRKDISLPAFPCFSDKSDFDLGCTPNAIGITLNGISIYSKYAGGYCDEDNDGVVAEADTFDACSGHAAPTGGDYHYHIPPACLLKQLNDTDENPIKHSPLIGWAYDGFPIYGPHGINGTSVYPCTHSNAISDDCLDSCNGHSHHEIDGFKYHYHISGPIGDTETSPVWPIPDTDFSPYSIGCLVGVPYDWDLISDATSNGASCRSDGYTSEYMATAINGVTDKWSGKVACNGDSDCNINYYWSDSFCYNVNILIFFVTLLSIFV